MAKALSPAYMRLGGTAADLMVFDGPAMRAPKTEETSCYHVVSKQHENKYKCEDLNALYRKGNFTLTKDDWLDLNEFCDKVNMELLFDFNLMRRDAKGNWDPSNAEHLLKFTEESNVTKNMAFELGNEPNSLWHSLHFNITGSQMGRDYRILKKLLRSHKSFKNSKLLGPDLNAVRKCDAKGKHCKALKFLGKFLRKANKVVDAVTWHHYYLDGHKSKGLDFINPRVMDNFQAQVDIIADYLKKMRVNPDIWLGETGSSYGGGTPMASDRFVSTYLWLDKLGVAARNNYKVIIRQSFYHGAYGMIGEDLQPNPDFWISLIYKKVVGTKVLNVTNPVNPEQVRLYAHCAKDMPGGVTLFGMNVHDDKVSFLLPYQMRWGEVHEYIVSAPYPWFDSRTAALNGELMQLVLDKTVPELKPFKAARTDGVGLKANELFFFVFPHAKAKACL